MGLQDDRRAAGRDRPRAAPVQRQRELREPDQEHGGVRRGAQGARPHHPRRQGPPRGGQGLMSVALAPLVSLLLAVPAAAASPAPALRGVGAEETLGGGPVLASALDAAKAAAGVPTLVRLAVTPEEVTAGAPGRASLEERLSLYAARKVPVVLAL